MGLDMYLRAKKHVSGYPFYSAEEQELYARVVAMAGVEEIIDPDTPSGEIAVVAAYWRKSNAIHNWFVQNVQDGEDECKPHYVSREQLQELKLLCEQLLDAHGRLPQDDATELVLEKMPPTQGFFFGSTDIDHWFWEDLADTVKQLRRALSAPEGISFEYQASW
jgi:hypothetical protein